MDCRWQWRAAVLSLGFPHRDCPLRIKIAPRLTVKPDPMASDPFPWTSNIPQDLSAAEAPEATRDLVLRIAARHFAEHDFRGTSLRAIQREAGVNPATVHYHFGSKEQLYQEVIGQFLGPVQAERMRRLQTVPDNLTGPERLRLLLHHYIAPHLEIATTPRGYDYALILAYVQVSARDAATEMFDTAVGPVRRQYIAALAPLLPGLSRRRIDYLLGMAVAHMAMVPVWLGRKSADPQVMTAAIGDTVAFAAAGFEALGRSWQSLPEDKA